MPAQIPTAAASACAASAAAAVSITSVGGRASSTSIVASLQTRRRTFSSSRASLPSLVAASSSKVSLQSSNSQRLASSLAGTCSLYLSSALSRQPIDQQSTGSASASSSYSTDNQKSSTRDQPTDDSPSSSARPRRSLLYVPGSSEKMIKGSQKTDADCIIFDLEDSVAPHRKGQARETVLHGLNAAPRPGPELAVRINPPSGDVHLASDDLDVVLPSHALQAIVLPKVESAEDVYLVLDKAAILRPEGAPPIALILSIESAASLHNMPTIISSVQQRIAELTQVGATAATPGSVTSPPHAYLSALLFASEDFCAATSIVRTRDRRSLLTARSQVVLTARAFGLSAIDMVCIDLKDEAYLIEETQEAKELGFDAKQVVHPAQVAPVQHIFAPSEAEVRRAARIKLFYERGISAHVGAVALPEEDDASRQTMIDAPMLKQADVILSKAVAAKMKVPDIGAEERAKKVAAPASGSGTGENGRAAPSRGGGEGAKDRKVG